MTNKNFFHSKYFLNFSCLAIFLLSIFLRSTTDIGADTGIYLNLAKKISRGGKYYYDFFESNFPLSFYFYYLQYEIAQLLHLSPIILSEIVINSLALGAIFWSAKILEKTTINNNKAHYNLMIVSYFLSFFLRPYALQYGEFGTKTSLLLIALYPYLSFSFERKIALTKKELIQRGCLMGLMPCIKPHYLILILFIELKYFFQKKPLNVTPSNDGVHLDKLVMILIGALYLFLMLKFTPEFFEFIVPMWPKTYSAYDDYHVFLKNLWGHFGARICVFSFIFLIFSRLKADQNDKILVLLFAGASTLIVLENIGTADQIVVFYAAITICFLKFSFDLIRSKKILFSENKFIICCLAFLPLFDLKILPATIFGLDGFITIWWVFALFYPSILALKLEKNQRRKLLPTPKIILFIFIILALLTASIFALQYCGGWACITINLTSLLVTLLFFEKKIAFKLSEKFSVLSVFVIVTAMSCLFYSYVTSIVVTAQHSDPKATPSKLYDMIAYYSLKNAPEKEDGILMISSLNLYQFPLLNYLEKEDYQKYHVASLQADRGVAGSGKMFETGDLDQVFTLSYLFDDVKSQAKNPKVKVIFVNNSPEILDRDDRCLINTLEYYFSDPEFKKIFLQNFHFENHPIITREVDAVKKVNLITGEKDSVFDALEPTTKRVSHDFEVYLRNEKK